MSKDFASIHTHTEFSNLDGASKVPELVARAKELGMSSVGISDHGNLSGLVDFYKECKKQDVRPVLGQEFYFTDDRTLKESVKQENENGIIDGSDKRYYHLSIYAEDNAGYQNLLKLSSDAFTNGFWFKPRSDYEILEKHSKGIIVGSGCLGGPVLQPLLHGNFQGALDTAKKLQDAVGKDNFFIELMNHGLPEQYKTNPQLIEIAKKIGAKYYCSQDSHYTHKQDAHAHSILLCCQTGAKLSDPLDKRFHFHADEYYLKSADEMYDIFKDNPEACDNTLLIAERCNVKIDFDSLHLPNFPVPWGFKDDVEYLIHLVKKGIDKFYPDANDEVYDRAAYELSVFQSMGVSSYMLILWDLLKFARNEGIFTPPGRGSAAGSIVSYVLGITKVDPLEYDLIFERFLNPSRIALPDVDLDIEQRYRDKMINYTIEKYGTDRVAQIITFGRIKARTAVRDAARVLSYPPALGDKISKLMPPLNSGVDTPLSACFEYDVKYAQGYGAAQGLRELYESDPQVQEIVDAAKGIEGLVKSTGIHAAGVVIGDRPLDELIPLWKNKDGVVATQWNKKVVEALGLVKMDYLGLKNLDILSDTEKMIGGDFKIDNLPMDDAETYAMLRTGETIGCFQIECLAGDTLIGKNLTIKQLYENPSLRKKLLSVYIDSGRRRQNTVLKIVAGGNKKVFRLVTESGRYIKASAEHKFLTEDGWKALKDLSVDDKILMSQGSTQIYRTCIDCGVQLNNDSHVRKEPERCYQHSAAFHKNPSKNKELISQALKKSYESGRTPWNKGLTKHTSEILKSNGEKISQALMGRTWEDLYGFERAQELRKEQSIRSSGENCHFFGKVIEGSGSFKNAKSGYREDLGHSVRSAWEADVARLLLHLGFKYEYEETRFYMEKKDGIKCSYLPDFYIPSLDLYIEVKGYYRDDDKEKMELFYEQHPEINLLLIDKTKFAELQLEYKYVVPNWECPVIPDFSWLESIISIDELGIEETFDICMESPGNNYIANGFVVHNSGGMRSLLKRLKPSNINDISAVLALFRPGPMAQNWHNDYADRKNGRQAPTPFHSEAQDILESTYGLCIHEDEEIYTKNGPVKIKDIKIGDWVYGEEGKLGQVTNILETGTKDTYEVVGSNGRRFRASGDHPILTDKGYKKIIDLTEDDLIATPINLESSNGIDDPNLAIILGALLSEGYLPSHSSFTITNNDEEYRDRVRVALHARFNNLKVVDKFNTRAWAMHITKLDRHLDGYHTPNELKAYIRSIGLEDKKSYTKFIPEIIHQMDQNSKLEFLASYIGGDGHVGSYITIRTISPYLAVGLSDICMSLGICTTLHQDNNKAYTLLIQDNEKFNSLIAPKLIAAKRKFLNVDSYRGFAPVNIKSIWAESGLSQRNFSTEFNISKSTIWLNKPISQRRLAERLGYTSPYFWYKATVNKLDYQSRMYDIEVDKIHSFIVGSFVVHNCIFQEQIMQLSTKFAGYSLTEADNLRKIIGKKLPDEMKAEAGKFINGCVDQGFGETLGKELFNMIDGFSLYGFNKCLVGDTLIKVGNSHSLSINEIEMCLKLNTDEPLYLASYLDGEMVLDECVEVINSGELEVFEITFDDGSTIEATLDHKFLCVDDVYYTVREIYERELEMVQI